MALTNRPHLQEQSDERRFNRRYPLESDMAFRIVRRRQVLETGSGRTVNISASGVLFESPHPMLVGDHIELSIAWPAQLDNNVRLQLCVMGHIVWSRSNCTAVQFRSYEFRTAGPSKVCQLTKSCQLRGCPVGSPQDAPAGRSVPERSSGPKESVEP